MGDVVDLKNLKRPSNKEKARRKTMCRSGFHKWEVDQKKQFDVKQGRLVTIRRCRRCGETRVTAD
jgi:hypothetical protein